MQMNVVVMNRKFRNHSFYSVEFWFIVAYYLTKGELCQKSFWFLADSRNLCSEDVVERGVKEINSTFLAWLYWLQGLKGKQ